MRTASRLRCKARTTLGRVRFRRVGVGVGAGRAALAARDVESVASPTVLPCRIWLARSVHCSPRRSSNASRSASARNLAERQAGTLMILEPDTVVYVKTRAVDGPLDVAGDEGLGYFLLGV